MVDEAHGRAAASAVEQDQRVRHRLELEFGSRQEWDNPRREWRRLFSELLETFFLVLVAAGGGILVGKGQISLAAAVVAPGLMVMAIILFMGAISGAHLNPAVSLAFALRGDFPWQRVPGYIIIQLIGATLACLFLLAVFGNIEHLGATLPGTGYANWQALLMETALTAGLVSVILGTASAAQNVGASPRTTSRVSRRTTSPAKPRARAPQPPSAERRAEREGGQACRFPCKVADLQSARGTALVPDASSYLSRSSTDLDT